MANHRYYSERTSFRDLMIMIGLIIAMNFIGHAVFSEEQWAHPARFWIVQAISTVTFIALRWRAYRIDQKEYAHNMAIWQEVQNRINRNLQGLGPNDPVTKEMILLDATPFAEGKGYVDIYLPQNTDTDLYGNHNRKEK